jgi:selenocysteine-specific translation elongation factor
MDGITVGVFGTDSEVKSAFEAAVAKKSEAEGIAVHTRTEGGRRCSLLDTSDYPSRVQGYARIASICDLALYFYPRSGRLAPPDGELAVLLGALGLPGKIVVLDRSSAPEAVASSLKGTAVSQYSAIEYQSGSAAIDFSGAGPRQSLPAKGTLVYIDRTFTVKGVGTVALGFVLSGEVKVHDQLRPIPGPGDKRADVKGIQVSDVDFDAAGPGIRVGLSLRGVEPSDLERSHWLDDGSFPLANTLSLDLSMSPFYRQEVAGRDLHLQLPGEMVPAKISGSGGSEVAAALPWQVPAWGGMRSCLVDLNGGNLRIAGGATAKF